MNLFRGYVGDTYPLCTDLGARTFLRKGARFRYLGERHPVPELSHGTDWSTISGATRDNAPPFAPDPSQSALYAALCDADLAGRCRFRSAVTLNASLACHGVECGVETIRVVTIVHSGSEYHFEYMPPACVAFGFLETGEGRYVESLKDDTLQDRLCMEPGLAVGAAACCVPASNGCFDLPCEYVEEKLSYEGALGRCRAYAGTWEATPPSPPAAPGWFLYPSTFRLPTTECPANSSRPTEAECWAAAGAALVHGGEPHFRTPIGAEPSTESRGNWPAGCIVKTKNNVVGGKVVWNAHESGGGSGEFKVVCHSDDAALLVAANLSLTGSVLCPRKRKMCQNNPSAGRGCRMQTWKETLLNAYLWSEVVCRVQVQVHMDGRVAIVHPGSAGADPKAARMQPNSENWFRVNWAGGRYPTAATGCASSCSVHARPGGDTCLCELAVETTAVFTDALAVPSQASVEAALFVGAPSPDRREAGTAVYTLCTTAACAARSPSVNVYTKGTASAPRFDADAIFEIVVNQTRTLHLANKRSTVALANDGGASAFSFRNPPQIISLYDATQRDALYEVDALLDHLFYHPNVAPFVALRLINHLVASNPSPRYVSAATTAFHTGVYEGRTFTGEYGDLGAMVAAILLDREARSLVLLADPSHGKMREPYTRLLHALRASEVTVRDGKELEPRLDLVSALGQAPYRFNHLQLPWHWSSATPCHMCRCSNVKGSLEYRVYFGADSTWPGTVLLSMEDFLALCTDMGGKRVHPLLKPRAPDENSLGGNNILFLRDSLHVLGLGTPQ